MKIIKELNIKKFQNKDIKISVLHFILIGWAWKEFYTYLIILDI